MAIPLPLETSSPPLRETLEVAERGRLVIGAWPGSVCVRAGGRHTLEVLVRGRGLVPAVAPEIERHGDDVYVETRSAPLLPWLPHWVWREVRLEVSVPAGYSVDVETRGGRVEIQGMEGEVEARSRAGSLVFRNVRGPIDGRTRSGSITVLGCRGDVDVATASGAIQIEGATATA